MKPCELSLRPKGPVERQVGVMVGGPATGGISSLARKAYACMKVQKRPQPHSDPGITFESESEYPNHDDALVVTTRITNACLIGMIKYFKISQISRLENFRADALARSTSADTPGELLTILCQPMVATIETVTMVTRPN
ncbi:hypothetical protein B296_00008268 [Ensete ventricosum]|uniref:Uncharacterized protein n=1 Tax=Ensete ventricosum TaxID=4639 RepID=A0A427A5F3_ENSVE|nr:hypothetical protein B296_00008268 [Ensete ventricosum]